MKVIRGRIKMEFLGITKSNLLVSSECPLWYKSGGDIINSDGNTFQCLSNIGRRIFCSTKIDLYHWNFMVSWNERDRSVSS